MEINATNFPTLTEMRKFGATYVANTGNIKLQEQLAEHMSHLSSTSSHYYRSRGRHMTTITSHRAIAEIMCKPQVFPYCF